MDIPEDGSMGEVRINVRITNLFEKSSARHGAIDPADVSEAVVEAVVDTGATSSVLPASLAARLGLEFDRTETIILADGSVHDVPIAEPVEFEFLGRRAVEECLVMGDEVRLGQFFLEHTDLFVDSPDRRLVGNPDHPDRKIHKIRSLVGTHS